MIVTTGIVGNDEPPELFTGHLRLLWAELELELELELEPATVVGLEHDGFGVFEEPLP